MNMTVIVGPSDLRIPTPGLCADEYFSTHAAHGLVWLPAIGMGYLRVQEDPASVYSADYFTKYQGYAATPMGQQITDARVQLVSRYVAPLERAIDVGIGCGDFLEGLLCAGFVRALGYDINPAGVDWLGGRSLFCDPYEHEVDALFFWDAIEHIPDAHRMLANARRWVFVTVPIVPGDGPPSTSWRHWRPTEHCFYWTRDGFIAWMSAQGFACLEHNTMESLLGRLDSHTFVFRRRA